MSELIVFAFLALLNGSGMMGGAEQTLEACQKSRAEIFARSEVLWASECAPVKLVRMAPQVKKEKA